MGDDEKRWMFLLFGTDNPGAAGDRGRLRGHQWEWEGEGEAREETWTQV